MEKFILLYLFTIILAINKNDIPDFDKYYKPQEFKNMDMFSEDAKYSFTRYKQSEHFFVFWEAGFGDNPNSENVPSNLRVDIDDLLAKAEQFYNTNIVKTKFSEVGKGKSYLDIYKMEIYLVYTTEWLATGSGYDNVIGALWVNPSTCQPVGSVIAHEIGHSFQYQVYCDQIYTKQTGEWDFKTGFRYTYEGATCGNGFWEQTAQWQSFQDYPDEMFYAWTFSEWENNYHRHFEHELMRYGSYWLHVYWAEKYGLEAIGNIWKKSKYPDDAITTYMKLYDNNNYDVLREELFDYAMKIATYDLDTLRIYSLEFVDRYKTVFYSNNGYYQVAYASCPGATGFNVIPLKVSSKNKGKEISVEFVGLEPGSALASSDPGQTVKEDGQGSTVRNYNNVNKGNVGWRYGFVTINSDDSRTYSNVFSDPNGIATFQVPSNVKKLFMVVQGSPNSYIKSAWDDEETTDAQFPYKVKFTNTSLK
jgi:hypothetical protein